MHRDVAAQSRDAATVSRHPGPSDGREMSESRERDMGESRRRGARYEIHREADTSEADLIVCHGGFGVFVHQSSHNRVVRRKRVS